jgi:peptidoglycan hydrolase-like protein with peptidoglycan-binding domain
VRHAAGTGARHRNAAGRPHGPPIRSRLVRRLQRLVNGEINDKTTAAIKTFQRDRKLKETGVLNPQERALLAAAAKAKQAQVGWSMVDDPVTGARIGLPAKQVPNKSQTKNGTRWSSAQGQVQVETFKIREPGTTLAAVYEQQKREPATRKLEVNFLRPDFFILSGMQNLKKFYVRAEIKDGEVRGMTVLYDQATETIMDPVVVVMSSAFYPFPGVSGVAAMAGPIPKRKVEYGTGIVVSTAGHILTDREVTEGCNVIVVSGYGDADRAGGGQVHRPRAAADLWRARSRARDVSARLSKVPTSRLLGIADPQSQGGGSAISAMAARPGARRSSLRRSSAFPAAPRSTAKAALSAWWSSGRRPLPMRARQVRSRWRRWCRRRPSAPSSRRKGWRPRQRAASAPMPPGPRWCG